MNEIMMYSGIVLGILCFILSIYFFFKGHVIEVVKYLLHKNYKKPAYRIEDSLQPTKPLKTSEMYESDKTTTEMLTTNDTEIIEIAQNYATALLDASETDILPDLNK